ncbi:hypothetical protein FACS1894124_7370 [Spirochaetia bacterium]|nr:hypothetical protein FACS1894124_7370 [Spirochaetia bacterium]
MNASRYRSLAYVAAIFFVLSVSDCKEWFNTEPDTPNGQSYLVTFYTNGGSSVQPQQIAQGQKVIKPADPVWDAGYHLVAWYSDVELTKIWDFNNNTVLEENTDNGELKLYAYTCSREDWRNTTIITFHTDLGSTAGSPIPTAQIIPSGFYASEPFGLKPFLEGYRFGGWLSSSRIPPLYDFTTTVTGDIDLYAHWIEQVTVTFNVTGGTPECPPIVMDIGESISTHPDLSPDPSPALPEAPTKPGFNFAGWYTFPNGIGTLWDGTIPVNNSIVLYAHWTS